MGSGTYSDLSRLRRRSPTRVEKPLNRKRLLHADRRSFQLNKSCYDFRRYGRHCQSKMLVPKGRDHAWGARDTADRRKGIGQRRPTSDPFRLVRGFADRLDDLLGESLEHPRPLPSRGRILAHDLDRSGQTDTLVQRRDDEFRLYSDDRRSDRGLTVNIGHQDVVAALSCQRDIEADALQNVPRADSRRNDALSGDPGADFDRSIARGLERADVIEGGVSSGLDVSLFQPTR